MFCLASAVFMFLKPFLLYLTWQGEKLWTGMVYPNMASTEIRMKLRLRSTVRGANNRLDIESLLSFDRHDNTATSMIGALPLASVAAVTVPPNTGMQTNWEV